MHIDLTPENENSIRELSVKLNLSAAFIVNLFVKAAYLEIENDTLILQYKRSSIDQVRNNIHIAERN